MSCKTRKLSLTYQGFKNYFMIFGWSTELTLTIFLAYLMPINYAFGTRDVLFIHYALPSFPFSIMMFIYDETRKYLIRNWDGCSSGGPAAANAGDGKCGSRDLEKQNLNWFERNTLW